MKGSSLAILLGGKPKAAEEDDAADEDATTDEDYSDLAKEAFPDEEWTPKRVAALKQFVMACMG